MVSFTLWIKLLGMIGKEIMTEQTSRHIMYVSLDGLLCFLNCNDSTVGTLYIVLDAWLNGWLLFSVPCQLLWLCWCAFSFCLLFVLFLVVFVLFWVWVFFWGGGGGGGGLGEWLCSVCSTQSQSQENWLCAFKNSSMCKVASFFHCLAHHCSVFSLLPCGLVCLRSAVTVSISLPLCCLFFVRLAVTFSISLPSCCLVFVR